MTRFAVLVLLLLGCGHTLPQRYVVERDLDGFAYRRYQKTLDVEVAIAGNQATGHTASYLRRGGSKVAVATAFVSVYQRAASLAAEARERLMPLPRYHVEVQDVGPGYAFVLDADPAERWMVWVSGRYLVKLGAPAGEAVPEALIDAYMDLYPSDLDEHGRAREGTASAGRSKREREQAAQTKHEQEVPRFLREGAPR
jgi:hypothetical protein